MKSILGRISKLEVRHKAILPPVFVESLDDLDTRKQYSVIFCESKDIHRAHEYIYDVLIYGELEE